MCVLLQRVMDVAAKVVQPAGSKRRSNAFKFTDRERDDIARELAEPQDDQAYVTAENVHPQLVRGSVAVCDSLCARLFHLCLCGVKCRPSVVMMSRLPPHVQATRTEVVRECVGCKRLFQLPAGVPGGSGAQHAAGARRLRRNVLSTRHSRYKDGGPLQHVVDGFSHAVFESGLACTCGAKSRTGVASMYRICALSDVVVLTTHDAVDVGVVPSHDGSGGAGLPLSFATATQRPKDGSGRVYGRRRCLVVPHTRYVVVAVCGLDLTSGITLVDLLQPCGADLHYAFQPGGTVVSGMPVLVRMLRALFDA